MSSIYYPVLLGLPHLWLLPFSFCISLEPKWGVVGNLRLRQRGERRACVGQRWHWQQISGHPQASRTTGPDPQEQARRRVEATVGTPAVPSPEAGARCQWFSHPKKLLCSAVQQTDWGRGVPASCWLVADTGYAGGLKGLNSTISLVSRELGTSISGAPGPAISGCPHLSWWLKAPRDTGQGSKMSRSLTAW